MLCDMQTIKTISAFFLVLYGLFYSHGEEAETRWSILRQSDYDLKLEIAKVESFNRSIFKYAKLDAVPYNRTLRALNGSFEILVDLTKKITVTIQTGKFLSNEYRYFPMSFEIDACTEYRHNSFGLKQLFDRTSNIRPCSMKKGLYYIINALPDFSKFPPRVPFGRYCVHLDNRHRNNEEMLTLLVNIEIKEKPINWKLL